MYQLPAVIDGEGKLTLVLSPLKALQLDQVKALCSKGIRAAVLNSDLSPSEHHAVLADMTAHGGLLYLAPEQLQNPAVVKALHSADLRRIAVDEAHILPQSKDDFRKAYGAIGGFIRALPQRPQVLALTATATRKDVARIRKSLGIPDADLFRTPMRRELSSALQAVNPASGNGSYPLRLRWSMQSSGRWENGALRVQSSYTARRSSG